MIGFKNMKIGIRLGLGFGSILLIMCLLNIFTINRIQTMGKNLDDLYTHSVATRTAALETRANIITVERYMREIALAKDSHTIDTIAKIMDVYI